MKDIDTSILNEIGLNNKEKTIYIMLLKKQSSSANNLAKLTKINRTTVYLELNSLIDKGLVSHSIQNNKKVFNAKEPKVILEILEERKTKIKQLIPQLELLTISDNKPQIEIYEGKDGIKTMYLDFLKIKTEQTVYVMGSTGYGFQELKYYYPQYYKKIINVKLSMKIIANKNTKEEYVKNASPLLHKFVTKHIDKQYYSEVTTVILKDTVYMQSFKDNLYLIKIQDKNLAKSYRNQFKLIWDLLPNSSDKN